MVHVGQWFGCLPVVCPDRETDYLDGWHMHVYYCLILADWLRLNVCIILFCICWHSVGDTPHIPMALVKHSRNMFIVGITRSRCVCHPTSSTHGRMTFFRMVGSLTSTIAQAIWRIKGTFIRSMATHLQHVAIWVCTFDNGGPPSSNNAWPSSLSYCIQRGVTHFQAMWGHLLR